MAAKRRRRKRPQKARRSLKDIDLPIAYVIRAAILAFMAWQGVKSGDTDLTKWNADYLRGVSQQVSEIQRVLEAK